MNKTKLLQIISSHYNIFHFFSNIYNRIKLKNKLSTKGCKISVGISVLNGLKIISHGVDNEVFIGDFVHIKKSVIILHGSHNKISIGDFSSLNEVEMYMEDGNNEISIGKKSNLCGRAHFAAIEGTKILIGDNCLFSSELHFRTGDSHSVLDINGKRINPSKDIIIDNHVWIGTKVTCLKGVHVAENSIVAATTTLCKNYTQKNVIIGGVPGKVIKEGVNWCNERIK